MALPLLNAYLDDGGDEIVLVEQTPDGLPKERRVRAQYTTYHRAEDIDHTLMRVLKRSDMVRSIAKEGDDWVRVTWTSHETRRTARYKFKDQGVEVFEGDVDPVMFHLVHTNAKIARPRRFSLDLETDSRVPLSRKQDMRILSWAITDFVTEKTTGMLLEEDTDDAEEALLLALVEEIEKYDQALIWEGDWDGGEFDSFVFDARVRRRGIGVDARRWMWLNQLAVWRKMNQHSAESGAEKESMKLGDIAFEQIGEGKEEVPDFVRERFGEKADRGLGAITWELWEAGGKFRELLLTYNKRDAELLVKLEKRKQFLTLFQAVCEVCGIPPVNDSLQPTRQMDGYILRLGRELNHRFPSKTFREDHEDKGKFKGAVVFRPKSVPHKKDETLGIEEWTREDATAWLRENGFANGILRDVHVCDFSSLYPSVMRTYNLDGSTIVGRRSASVVKKDGVLPGTIWSPGTCVVTTAERKGFLPLAFETLTAMRKKFSDLAASLEPGSDAWKDAMAISTAYKVTSNSFYGGGATPFSRFNNRDASESCTQNGVHFLKLTAEEAEKREMVLVYGDTDSNMVIGTSEDAFRTFVSWLNRKKFPEVVKSHGCVENHISLAFEKTFERVVFLSAKAYIGRFAQYKGTPATRECHGLQRKFDKKRGDFIWFDPTDPDPKNPEVVSAGPECRECGSIGGLVDEPEIKGVAYKRGDRGKLARELQGKIIDLLVGGVRVRGAAGKKVPIFQTGTFSVEPGLRTPTEDLQVYRRVIEAARNHVLAEPLPLDEVRLSAGLKGSLKSYAKDCTDAHVRIARILEARGQLMAEGVRVEYVVVDGSRSPQEVIPAEDYAGDCDRFYLWERVYRPSMTLLESAFPEEDWGVYEDVRPRKTPKRAQVAEEQLGLMLKNPEKRLRAVDEDMRARMSVVRRREDEDRDELAVPMFRSQPLIVRVPEEAGEPALIRLKEVFKQHPGAQQVQIVIALKSGAEAMLGTPIRVSPGPKLREAVDRAIQPDGAAAP